MLYLVLYHDRIIGRFKDNKEKAINYMIDCWFDGLDDVTLKTATKEEYLEMKKEYLEKARKEVES